MTNHCAVACPVVTEAVKAATPESKIAMAIAAIESDKITLRAAAERFGVSAMSLSRAKRKRSPVPTGTGEQKGQARTTAKDGKPVGLPVSPAEIESAWARRDSGESIADIAVALDRNRGTIYNWLKKPRPELAASPDPPPLTLEQPKAEPKPKRPQVPSNLKQAHRKEQKWINERWIPVAQHLAEAHRLIRLEHRRLQSEYAGPQGSLLMVNRWEAIAKLWAESGDLAGFTAATGNPDAVTLAGLLSELERSARMSGQWIGSIEIWTGCKPDSTRYQPTTPTHPNA
jgi:transposase